VPDKTKQYASSDGCVYFYDRIKKLWKKVCDVDVLPQDVKEQIQEEFNEADALRKTF
jgi:hypothetical protein